MLAKEPTHLVRKMILLFLLITGSALGIFYLFTEVAQLPLPLFGFLADATLGLIAGLGSRIVLHKRGWFVRFIVAIALSVVGLAILGYITDWKLGIGLLEANRRIVDWAGLLKSTLKIMDWVGSLKSNRATVDWVGLTHLMTIMFTATIALQAWHRPIARQVVEVMPLASLPTPQAETPPRRRRTSRTPSKEQPRVQLPESGFASSRRRARPKSGTRSRTGRHSTVLKRTNGSGDRSARSNHRGRFNGHKPQIQLALVEEHRCPYCLELVMHNDARGVKECEVCHTMHHADCWAITGICQVPHLNT